MGAESADDALAAGEAAGREIEGGGLFHNKKHD